MVAVVNSAMQIVSFVPTYFLQFLFTLEYFENGKKKIGAS